MKVRFVLENGKRRPLVDALSGALGADARYLGAPSFMFEVGGCMVDRDGVLDIPEELDHGALLERLAETGFLPEKAEPMQEETKRAGFIIPVPAQDFSARVKDNLDKLLAAKGGLIMAALGVGRLTYTEDHGYLAFDLYDREPEKSELVACTHLLNALYNTAREQVRVTAKATDVENLKYAMRCFMLRLGFIGPEYKQTRSILLSRLTGNPSFKSGR